MIITRAPFRICLGGGGTDLPSFYEDHGGFVVSMAIDKHVYICLKPNIVDHLLRLQYLKTEIVEDASQLLHTRARASLELHDLRNSVEIVSVADLPANSGMGSSAAYLISLLAAIRAFQRKSFDPHILASEACHVEIDVLKEPVGKQDQFISAYGGIRTLDISKEGPVEVSHVNISNSSLSSFLSNLHIYHLGISRSASEILSKQNTKDKDTQNRLLKIKSMGYEFLEAIETENFDKYGLLMDDYWNIKKRLSSGVTVPIADKIYEEVKNRFGVLGGKIIGAGGGGFLMLYAPHKHSKLESFMEARGLPRLHYSTDYRGVKIISDAISSHDRVFK